MAEDLSPARGRGQEGFSMIEMLMTAFILAIGLLGLSMLQTMSLRASRGSTGLSTAVHVADTVMDQIELEGRLSWLNTTEYNPLAAASVLPHLYYLTLTAGVGSLVQNFNSQGTLADPTSTDPLVKYPYYTVTVTRVADVGTPTGVGQLSDFNVQVQFSDNANNVVKQRQVTLTRRILHG